MLPGNFHQLFTLLFLGIASVALFSFLAVAAWSKARRQEREAYYRSETVKKIAETPSTAVNSALELLREQDKIAARKTREGVRLGGLVTTAVGIGLFPLLWGIEPREPVYLVGLIPLLIGVALLTYGYLLAPKE